MGDYARCIEKSNYNDLGYDTKLKSNVEINKEKTYVLPDGNIIAAALNVSMAPKYWSSQISLAMEPAGSTTLLFPDLHEA